MNAFYLKDLQSPLGVLTAACTENAICGLWFREGKHYRYGLPEGACEAEHPLFDELEAWLQDYFAGKKPEITLDLQPMGTAFQLAVCDELRKIPYGETTTYGVIAKNLSLCYHRNMSARAVGGAVGRNPISILIPCHRVIGADRSLTGFAAGLERKIHLLKLEGSL